MGRTSTEVKRRYNDKTYSHINIAVPKELAADFKAQCAERGVSQAQVLQEAMKKFMIRDNISIQIPRDVAAEIAERIKARPELGRLLIDATGIGIDYEGYFEECWRDPENAGYEFLRGEVCDFDTMDRRIAQLVDETIEKYKLDIK